MHLIVAHPPPLASTLLPKHTAAPAPKPSQSFFPMISVALKKMEWTVSIKGKDGNKGYLTLFYKLVCLETILHVKATPA